VADSIHGLQGTLDNVYQEMLPLCSQWHARLRNSNNAVDWHEDEIGLPAPNLFPRYNLFLRETLNSAKRAHLGEFFKQDGFSNEKIV
jgi:hypothetical protein